jgi:hypothetical protein
MKIKPKEGKRMNSKMCKGITALLAAVMIASVLAMVPTAFKSFYIGGRNGRYISVFIG